MRGPHTWDQSGMPMADDDEGVITERIYADKRDPGLLRVEMTTIDNSPDAAMDRAEDLQAPGQDLVDQR